MTTKQKFTLIQISQFIELDYDFFNLKMPHSDSHSRKLLNRFWFPPQPPYRNNSHRLTFELKKNFGKYASQPPSDESNAQISSI